MHKTLTQFALPALHVAAWVPAAQIAYWWFSGQMTFNPIQDLTFATGFPALVFLVLTLAVTPVNTLFGWRWAIPLRRWLGLYAFFYATAHMLIFVVLDYAFAWADMVRQILEKQYILAGLGALLVMLPLALTSTKGWQKRLGRSWKDLHSTVYLAAILAVLHFIWLVKADLTQPLIFAGIVAVLLVMRIPAVRKWLSGLRQKVPTANKKASRNPNS
jgi:sulfoxide reductase heme-binding subunit YedZ